MGESRWKLTVRLVDPDLDAADRLGRALRDAAPIAGIVGVESGVAVYFATEAHARGAMARAREACPGASCVVEPGS